MTGQHVEVRLPRWVGATESEPGHKVVETHTGIVVHWQLGIFPGVQREIGYIVEGWSQGYAFIVLDADGSVVYAPLSDIRILPDRASVATGFSHSDVLMDWQIEIWKLVAACNSGQISRGDTTVPDTGTKASVYRVGDIIRVDIKEGGR